MTIISFESGSYATILLCLCFLWLGINKVYCTEGTPHLKRCGGLKHAAHNRPCSRNDTYCGYWKDRYFHPEHCKYQDISPEQARRCIGNRTLAFIGDSQTRDIAVGVGLFLLGQELQDASEFKVDYKHNMTQNATRVYEFDFWVSECIKY